MDGMIDRARKVAVPTIDVPVPEWDDDDHTGTVVKLRQLTRGQIDEINRHIAGLGKDEIVPGDLFGLLCLVYGFAEPDLVAEIGVDEALELVRAQPVKLLARLGNRLREWAALEDDSPKKSGDKDSKR